MTSTSADRSRAIKVFITKDLVTSQKILIAFLQELDNILSMANIPGLDRGITKKDLSASTKLHNHYPSDAAFPEVDVASNEFKTLCTVIAKYNLQSRFQIRLLHRHLMIPEGQILLSSKTAEVGGYWTKPVPIVEVELQNIRGHIFSINKTNCTSNIDSSKADLFPSEFCEGSPFCLGGINSNFFPEFAACLQSTQLEDSLGLEVKQEQSVGMIEFSFDIGSLLIPQDKVQAEIEDAERFKLQETGWAVVVRGEAVDQTGEQRCVTYETGHIKVTNSQLKSVSDAIGVLRDEGVLAI